MPEPLKAGLAPGIECTDGYIVRITALNPTTGATVANVVVSDVSMQVDTAEREPDADAIKLLPPILAHEPQTHGAR